MSSLETVGKAISGLAKDLASTWSAKKRPPTVDNKITTCSFNQDGTCVAVGTTTGFRIFTCDPYSKPFSAESGGCRLVRMVFSTSLVALVGSNATGQNSPRYLRLYNTKNNRVICTVSFTDTILEVRLNRSRLIAVLSNKIHIFELENMKQLHRLETPENPGGIADLSPCPKRCFLAFPRSSSTGSVFIFDANKLQGVMVIEAHENRIQILRFNQQGTLLTTASQQGTVIKVFTIPDGECTHTFRRGSFSTRIFSLSFDKPNFHLCVTSRNDTVHIFSLQRRRIKANTAVINALPEVLGAVLEPKRAFATVPNKEYDNLTCAFHTNGSLLIASCKGLLLQYSVPKEGGACKLISEHSILNLPDERIKTQFYPQELLDEKKNSLSPQAPQDNNERRNLESNFESAVSSSVSQDEQLTITAARMEDVHESDLSVDL